MVRRSSKHAMDTFTKEEENRLWESGFLEWTIQQVLIYYAQYFSATEKKFVREVEKEHAT